MARRELLLPAAVAAVGIGLGLLAEKALVGNKVRYDPDAEEEFGVLHGSAVPVAADDGVGLHVEVD
ncbi:MAG: hypothetical protein WC054_10430, partial [Candidatus Nanopelagicales bacterium]